MDWWDAVLLGIIQGLTEFLPISSSGHLELGKALLGDHSLPVESMLFTIVVHFATAMSTIVVYRKEIWQILKGLFQWRWNEELKFSLKIILSMVPAVFVGLFFENEIASLFGQNIVLVGFMLLITALLLLVADKAKNTAKAVSFSGAWWIGIAQAIAILPGISRSGATISTAVLLGVDKTKAARFSFLMVVPLILGSIAKSSLAMEQSYSHELTLPLFLGFVAAFITGLLACLWMIRLVRTSKLKYFAYYCLLVSLLALSYNFL